MNQTLGSQYLGPWYDILGFVLFAGVFFYFAFASLPLPLEQRLPPFLKNKKACVIFGLCFVGLAFYKVANKGDTATPVTASAVSAFLGEPEWVPISAGNDGETLSIDRKTVARNGDEVEYSEQLTFKTPRDYPAPIGPVTSMRTRLRVNCIERSRILLDLQLTKPNGTIVADDKSATHPKVPLSTDPTRPEYISSAYICDTKNTL